jgi:tRNA(adenine34) deaminase
MKHPDRKIMCELIRYTDKYAIKYGHATGVFIIKDGNVLSKAVTTVEKDKDPTSHAELKAISRACRKLKNYHLEDCYLYTTQEPCPMCASAIVWARMAGVIYGREGHKEWGKLDIPCKEIFVTSPKKIEVFPHFFENECSELKKKRDAKQSKLNEKYALTKEKKLN